MDLVSSCRDKLTYFRIKELKDALTQLGLAKQGKKQDLIDRILASLSEEQGSKSHGWERKASSGKERVAKIIDDTYRKMQVHGATDLAPKSHSGSEFNHMKPKEEIEVVCPKVRCICGSSLSTESMIKCEDPKCQIWQHIGCVILPDEPTEGALPELPSRFYCEICRINRADPFWVTVSHPLLPVMITSSGVAADGTSTVQSVEKTFQLSRVHRETLQRSEFDLQVWCMLLTDKVQFRMQWPQHADLQINGIQVRVVARPGSQLLGINGRDDGPVITTCSREGFNKICLERCDTRTFCFGIRIAKRRTVQQVLSLVPHVGDGETFDDALTRVRRCVGGGNAIDNADSDSDLEVVADCVSVNLRCPMSGSRIRIAGRFKPCIHMGCFDLETFVELNQRARKWQCPICLKNYSVENMVIDPYFNRITSLLSAYGEDVNEIDVKPDGSWRVKNEVEIRELGQWHLPDGPLFATEEDIKPGLDHMNQIKEEVTSEGHTGLRLGMKKNRNGFWEASKPDDKKPSFSGNHVTAKLENQYQNILQMSSIATGSCREGEDASVNQDGGVHFDLSLNNGHELDSISLNFRPTYNAEDRIPQQQLKDPEIVILSDSDEYNPTLYNPGPGDTVDFPFTANHLGFSERYPGDPGLGTNGTSCLSLFNNNCDDIDLNPWPVQNCSQPGPGFRFFGTDNDNTDALVDSHGTVGIAPTNGYGLASNSGIGDISEVQDLSSCCPNLERHATLVNNPLAFGSDDPSLQIFLPSRPSGIPLQAEMNECVDVPNGVHSDDWISLTLAAGDHESPADALGLQKQIPPKETRVEPLAGAAASALLSMNDNKRSRANSSTPRTDNIFCPPRQPRSVRHRPYLSIDTGSE